MSIEKLLTGHGMVRSLDRPSAQPPFLSLRHSPQVSTLSHHHFVEMSTELLRQGYSVRFQAPGNSMMPTVSDGERITVRPVSPSDIKPGDIILYRYPGSIFAHRVVRIEKRNGGAPRFILRGDASGAPDEPVEPAQVLGKVVSVERGGRSIDLYSRRAKMLRTAYVWASRVKRWIIRI